MLKKEDIKNNNFAIFEKRKDYYVIEDVQEEILQEDKRKKPLIIKPFSFSIVNVYTNVKHHGLDMDSKYINLLSIIEPRKVYRILKFYKSNSFSELKLANEYVSTASEAVDRFEKIILNNLK